MTVHELKTSPCFFDDVQQGLKTFEVRKNDRGFKVGDFLHLREYVVTIPERYEDTNLPLDSGRYTGREAMTTVTYIFDGALVGGERVLKEGYVCMAIKLGFSRVSS